MTARSSIRGWDEVICEVVQQAFGSQVCGGMFFAASACFAAFSQLQS